MAIQPPPGPPAASVPQQAAPSASAGRSGCFGRGCGCSCLGCLGVLVVATLLVLGSSYWFFVVQAQAAVNAPATLIVFNQPVTVDNHPGLPGEPLNAGAEVATQASGHAAVQFPDGSYVRMSPNTTLRITSVQLQKAGNLQTAEVLQETGRTFVNVQHLVNGATFRVRGHSVTAQVRGTQFEVLARSDNSSTIKVFDGTVTVTGRQTRTVIEGQEVDSDRDGNLSAVRPIGRDVADPYELAALCSRAVSRGTTAGTLQTSTGEPISTGQTSEVDYDSPGGTVSVALCYPGSVMTLSVIDPNGVAHASRSVASAARASVPGPAGRYRAIMRAVDVPTAEAFVVSFATDAPCVAGSQEAGTTVRETLSNSQIASGLADSGLSGVTLAVEGDSPTYARVVYYSNVGAFPLSWTIVFYAATPNLGAVITQVTVRGISVTTQVLKSIGTYAGASISSIPSGFTVDRVYSCRAANGDGMMVIEGHR